jgi:hypothetical protein
MMTRTSRLPGRVKTTVARAHEVVSGRQERHFSRNNATNCCGGETGNSDIEGSDTRAGRVQTLAGRELSFMSAGPGPCRGRALLKATIGHCRPNLRLPLSQARAACDITGTHGLSNMDRTAALLSLAPPSSPSALLPLGCQPQPRLEPDNACPARRRTDSESNGVGPTVVKDRCYSHFTGRSSRKAGPPGPPGPPGRAGLGPAARPTAAEPHSPSPLFPGKQGTR